MPQTVFDVGDPITSRLALGITPDGTTSATVTITRPDGTVITPTAISGWAVDVMTAQFYATDDGTPGGTTLLAAGDWLAVWKITGTGANVAAKVYNVAPLPGTGTRVAWSPSLARVALYIPRLTVDQTAPGTAVELGTFTGATNPTDGVAQLHIDDAVAEVLAACGPIPVPLEALARAVAALRAAASIQLAYASATPGLDTLSIAAALNARADADLAKLKAAIVDLADGTPGDEGDGFFDVLPVWTFPAASSWQYL